MSIEQRIETDNIRREIRKLATYLGMGSRYDCNPVRRLFPNVSINWSAPSGRPGADARLTVEEEGGLVFVSSWYESGHNGDSYDEERTNLEGEVAEKALVQARDRLLLAALVKAKGEIADARMKVSQERERAEALDHLLACGAIEK